MEKKAKDKCNKWGYKVKKNDYDTTFIIISNTVEELTYLSLTVIICPTSWICYSYEFISSF